MICRRWRLSVFLLVTLISVSFVIKSRTPPVKKSAAFMRFTTGSILVKLKGGEYENGVCRIFDSENSLYVNKMTVEGVAYKIKSDSPINRRLENGAVLEISGDYIRVLAERMTAVELIMLGIPLEPRFMTVADWDSLPGIGPFLANEINRYSQKNGGIASVEELRVLPGVGEGKLRRIKSFFR